MTLYVLGELRGEEAHELERLLRERPDLRGEIARLQKTFGLMPFATVTEPPPHLRSRILEAARQLEPATPPAAPLRPVTSLADYERKAEAGVRRRGRLVTVTRAVGSIAALLLVALAWDNYDLRRELQIQRDVATTLQQPNVVHQFALRPTNVASTASGTAVLDLDAKRAAVAIRGLPELPAGQVYRLWARVGDTAVPCGQFNANADGAVTSQFTIPVDAYTSPVRELFLNVEPAELGPKPVGRTVMVSA